MNFLGQTYKRRICPSDRELTLGAKLRAGLSSKSQNDDVSGTNQDKQAAITEVPESKTTRVEDLDTNPVQFRTWDGKLSPEAHDKEYMEFALRSGEHSDLVKKILRQRIEARAKDFPRWPAEVAGGVRSIWVESRFWYDRERLGPDFDEDWRTYRARYLHSLDLDPKEPVHVPEYERSLINPIRRLYMKPGDWLEDHILSKVCQDKMHSTMWRFVISRTFMAWVGLIGVFYWLKFNPMNWTEKFRSNNIVSRPMIWPGHPKFPFKDYRTEPAHHADQGFARRTIFKDLRDWEDTSVIL